jgi:hypothetical protein
MYLIAVLTAFRNITGMMGTMMAHETLKLIIGLPTLKNELVLFKTLNTNLLLRFYHEILAREYNG